MSLLLLLAVTSAWAVSPPSAKAPQTSLPGTLGASSASSDSSEALFLLREKAAAEFRSGNYRVAKILMDEVLLKAPQNSVFPKVIAADTLELKVRVKNTRENVAQAELRLKKLDADVKEAKAKLEAKQGELKGLLPTEVEIANAKKDAEKRAADFKRRKENAAQALKTAEDAIKEFEKNNEVLNQGFDKRLKEVDQKIAAARAQAIKSDDSESIMREISGLADQKRRIKSEKQASQSDRNGIDYERQKAQAELENLNRQAENDRETPYDRRTNNVKREIVELESRLEAVQTQASRMKHDIEVTRSILPD